MNGVGLDRAAWKRFSTANKDLCTVCGHQAEVYVTLTAKEKTGSKGGPVLVTQTFALCNTHGTT